MADVVVTLESKIAKGRLRLGSNLPRSYEGVKQNWTSRTLQIMRSN